MNENATVKVPPKLRNMLEPTHRLHFSKRNPRQHHSIGTIARSIQELGWHAPIVATASGEVIVGNGRLAAARLLGLDQVPVLRVPDDERTAAIRMMADNRLNELSAWSVEKLQELVDSYDLNDVISDYHIDEVLEDIDDLELVSETELDDTAEGRSTLDNVHREVAEDKHVAVITIGEASYRVRQQHAERLAQWLENGDTPLERFAELVEALQ